MTMIKSESNAGTGIVNMPMPPLPGITERVQGAAMGYRKLTPDEVSSTVAKIRSKYDFYCKHFYKSSKIKEEFENRYLTSIKGGVDVSNFLLAEIDAITELIKKEEDKLANAAPVRENKKSSIADKVIAENIKKIEKYPAVNFHKDANEEIKKLLGTLNHLHDELLPKLHSMFRLMSSNTNVRDVGETEARLRHFAYMGKASVPGQLSRYLTLLGRFPRDYKAMTYEENEYIRESSFLLHDLVDSLRRVYESLPEKQKENNKQLSEIIAYTENVISDFRLKDLKRKD